MSVHVLPVKTYLVVFGILLGLTGVTTWIAFQDLGFLNTVAAMTIAVAKMLLVVLWFMHVRWSSRLVWVFAAAGLLWFAILVAFTLSDFRTRALVEPWQ